MNHIKLFENFQLNEKNWKVTIDLTKEQEMIMDATNGGSMDFEDINKTTFKKIKKAIYDKIQSYIEEVTKKIDADEAGKLSDISEVIRDSDMDEWDNNWTDLYDWADDNNVWIKTEG